MSALCQKQTLRAAAIVLAAIARIGEFSPAVVFLTGDWLGARPVHHRRALSGTAAHGPEYLRQHPSQSMDLVDKIENDADAFVIDAQIVL